MTRGTNQPETDRRELLWWCILAILAAAMMLLVLAQSVHAAGDPRVTENCTVDSVEKFPRKSLWYVVAICDDSNHLAGFNSRRQFRVRDHVQITGTLDSYGYIHGASVRKLR